MREIKIFYVVCIKILYILRFNLRYIVYKSERYIYVSLIFISDAIILSMRVTNPLGMALQSGKTLLQFSNKWALGILTSWGYTWMLREWTQGQHQILVAGFHTKNKDCIKELMKWLTVIFGSHIPFKL